MKTIDQWTNEIKEYLESVAGREYIYDFLKWLKENEFMVGTSTSHYVNLISNTFEERAHIYYNGYAFVKLLIVISESNKDSGLIKLERIKKSEKDSMKIQDIDDFAIIHLINQLINKPFYYNNKNQMDELKSKMFELKSLIQNVNFSETYNQHEYVRLEKLELKNFKSVHELVLDFSKPKFDSDLDIFVFGSDNGIGKTTILEAITLLRIVDYYKSKKSASVEAILNRLDLDSFLQAGEKDFEITGTFYINGDIRVLSLFYYGNNEFNIIGDDIWDSSLQPKFDFASLMIDSFRYKISEPLMLPYFCYFHSYRTIGVDKPHLRSVSSKQKLVSTTGNRMAGRIDYSKVKLDIISALLSTSSVFDTEEVYTKEESEEILSFVNSLLNEFVGEGFHLDKMKYFQDGTIDILVRNNSGKYFSFDKLSSGQKEILETFYLIWINRKTFNIILIDEPELHLNAQWHTSFIQSLKKFCPNNQYILATHSKQIANSVEYDRRIYLSKE